MINNNELNISLAEALHCVIQEKGKNVSDVNAIMIGDLGLHIEDFWKSAAQCDWDINKLKDEFRIVFKDNTWIGKYYSRDGNVRLKYYECPKQPVCILLHPMPREFLDDC